MKRALLITALAHVVLVASALHPVPRRPKHPGSGGNLEATAGSMLDISTTRVYIMAADSLTLFLLTTFVLVSVSGLVLFNSGHGKTQPHSDISTGLPVPSTPCEDFASLALTAQMTTNRHSKASVELSEVRTLSIMIAHTPVAPPTKEDAIIPMPLPQQQPKQGKLRSSRTVNAPRTASTLLARAGSDVVMTFGTDQPEVYLSMLRKRINKKGGKCSCPCDRHSPPFARGAALALSATTKDMRLPSSLCTSSRESSTRALSIWGLSDDCLVVDTATTAAAMMAQAANAQVITGASATATLGLPRLCLSGPRKQVAAATTVSEWDGSDVSGGKDTSEVCTKDIGIPDDAVAICVADTFGGAGLTNRRRSVNGTRMSHVSGMTMIKEGVTGNVQGNVQGGEEVDVQDRTGLDGAEVRSRDGIILTKDLIVGNDRDVMMMRLQTHCRHDSVARSSVLSFVFAFLSFVTSLFHNTFIAGRPMVVRTFDHY